MKYFLSHIFLKVVLCTYTTVRSEDILDIEDKDLAVANLHAYNGNIGDVLNNKRFDYDIGNKDGNGILGIRDKFGFDDGNPDIHARIERPCQAYDTFCIRKFFAEHSKCKISDRQLPDPFIRQQSNFNYPSANMSVTTVNFMYGGLNNARVQEFYINKVTDNLVIAFNFDAISLVSNNTYVKYYLRGREPIVTTDFGNLIYLQITVTLVIPGLDNLRIDRAEIYTYAENPLLPFVVGPRLGLSSDPEVVEMFTYFGSVGVPVERLEGLSTEGVFVGTNYLQYNICDFGLKVL